MAKKAEKASETSVAAPSTPVAEVAPQSTEAAQKNMPETENTALSTTTTSAVAPVSESMNQAKALAARLPTKYKADVLMNPRPTPGELVNIVMSLPETEQGKMMEIVKKANPKKQGAHTARTSFAPTDIILYHGTGKDEMRPKNTIPGQFYTKGAQILGEKFEAAVIGFYEGRIMWPQRGQGGSAPEGGTAPLCYSYDREVGSRYGECNICPNKDRKYSQGGCMQEVTVFLLDRDMTSIYQLKFSKTSFGAGEALVKVVQKSENIWDRWITIESQERTADANRWFVIKTTPVQDTKNPANANTPKALHPLFSGMSRVLDHDVYFQGLADVYDRTKNSPDSSIGGNAGGNATQGETFDEKAMLGNAATDDNPDYSTDV